MYILKNLPTFAEKPELWDDTYFDDFMEEATFASMTFEEQEQYIASMKQKWDFKNCMDFAEQKGRENGLAQGLAQGAERQALETARRMLEDKVPVETIVKYSGLTEDQVRAL